MTRSFDHFNRRDFLRAMSAGGLALAMGKSALAFPGSPLVPKGKLYQNTVGQAKVALVKGDDRREIVSQALKKIEDQVIPALGNKKVLIKPNLVVTDNPLAATHVDTIRAILDFLKPHVKGQIIIGESSAVGSPMPGFQNIGYMALEKEYNCKLLNLNEQPFEYRFVIGRGNAPTPVRIISTFLDPDTYIISAARMKTHDRVVATLSLKNILMGTDHRPSGQRQTEDALRGPGHAHGRSGILHFNLFQLAQHTYPDMGVVDGFEAMEGDGPSWGTPVNAKIALASTDCLAMDWLGTKLMGFDPASILYLTSMSQAGMGQTDMAKIEVMGAPMDQCQYHFKPGRQTAQAYGLTS